MAGNHSSGTGGVLGSSELNRDTAGLQGTYGWAVQSGAVTFSTGLTFNVAAVATADYKVAGVNGASYAGGTVVLTAQDATNPRVDIIVITVAGAVSAVAGTPAALTTTGGPGPATPTAAQLEIARIYVPASGGLLSASSITDRRVALPDGAVTLTVTGDIIYASAAHTPARLPIGSAAQLLTVSGGLPAWATPASSPNVDIQAFAASGTWTKSASATANSMTILRMWGGGGGGAGAGAAAAGSYRGSGGAGGGGAYIDKWVLTSDLAATVTVTIGAAGTGGAGAASSPGSGTAGGAGGNTLFGTLFGAYGGGQGLYQSRGGGGGGTVGAGASSGVPGLPWSSGTVASIEPPSTSAAIGGSGGAGQSQASLSTSTQGGCAEYGGGGGGGSTNDTIGTPGGSSVYGGGGGGAGGLIDNANVTYAAQAGGLSGGAVRGGGGAAGAGGATGTAGTAGTLVTNRGGSGGGGGGFGSSGIGGVGGAGGTRGGGGGGGGVGTSAAGGAGGAGGIGYMQVITIL